MNTSNIIQKIWPYSHVLLPMTAPNYRFAPKSIIWSDEIIHLHNLHK